jgi:hypothetical protein
MTPVEPDPDAPRDAAQNSVTHPAGSATADTADVPVAGKHSTNYTAAVYGSVLAATVVVSAGDLRSPPTLAILLVASGITFWFAHVYAATVAGVHGGWQLGSIWTGMRHEWPVAFAAIPPAIAALVSALIPAVSVTDGVWAALIVAIVEQQLWGYAAVRNAKLSGPALTRTMLLNVFMGFIILALKLSVGH